MNDKTDIRSQKHVLRQAMKERKHNVPAEILLQESERIMHKLTEHPRFAAAQTVLIYCALPDEPRTQTLLENYLGTKRLLLPVVDGENMHIKAYRGTDMLCKGAFGIDEPAGICFDDYSEIDIAVIPGVAFDMSGGRLGRGRGYYDRFFSKPELSGLYKIGVCFSFQFVEFVPTESWDIKMNEIITV